MPISQEEIGTLIVVVLKARNLNDKHSFYKQDVFAQVSLNGVIKRTPVDVKGGQHPVWDAEIRFPVMKNLGDKHRKLEVACFAKEPRSDDILGKGSVDITETLRTGEFDDWVSLNIDGVVRGDLYLEMTFYAHAPAPATALSAPVSELTRRPSKLAAAERLYRPPQRPTPASQVDNRIHEEQRVNPHHSDRRHLEAPSAHSSRSSSASSLNRSESPLPPLPEGQLPLPSTLLPGRGRPNPLEKLPPRVPTTLRPGGKRAPPVAPLQEGTAYVRNSSLSPSRSGYHTTSTDSRSSYAPGSGSTAAALYAPPIVVPQSWASNDSSVGSMSFPVPTVTPVQGINYNAVPELSSQSLINSDLPDPYLQVRYQTPLPLPSAPPRGRQPSPSKTNEEAGWEETRLIEEEITRRKEQEAKDLALALQLDRELNLDE